MYIVYKRWQLPLVSNKIWIKWKLSSIQVPNLWRCGCERCVYFPPVINIWIFVFHFCYFCFITLFFRCVLYLQSVNVPFWSHWEEAAKRKLQNTNVNTVIFTFDHFIARHYFVCGNIWAHIYKFWIFLTQEINCNNSELKFDFLLYTWNIISKTHAN